jgi:hypothetical protein
MPWWPLGSNMSFTQPTIRIWAAATFCGLEKPATSCCENWMSQLPPRIESTCDPPASVTP